MTRSIRDLADAFDARSGTYGRSAWHRRCAERLVELCGPRPGARVLDAATGTGFAALAAARIVGPTGSVLGVDVSPGMLREASAEARASGVANLALLQADASRLPQYDDKAFDAITCAAGLLYMPVPEALREWHRLLAPGGVVAFSTMRAGSPPAGQCFRDCAASFGLSLRDPSEPLGTEAACGSALAEAGFEIAAVLGEVVEFSAQDLDVAWESNFRAPDNAAVRALPPHERAALEAAYRDALAGASRENPAALTRAGVLYALGRR